MRRVRVVLIFPVGAAVGCDLLILLLLFCGSWLASDGDLTADQSLAGVFGPPVGASLLAKTPVLAKHLCQLLLLAGAKKALIVPDSGLKWRLIFSRSSPERG